MLITRHLQLSVRQMMLFLQFECCVTDLIRTRLAYLFVDGCHPWYLCFRVNFAQKCTEGGAVFKGSDVETQSQ